MPSDPATQPKPRFEFKSRPKDSEREYRTPVHAWDRIRLLVFLLGAFLVLVLADVSASNMSFRTALQEQVSKRWWLLALAASRCSGSSTTTSRSSRRATSASGGTRSIEKKPRSARSTRTSGTARPPRPIPRVLLDPRGHPGLVHQSAG